MGAFQTSTVPAEGSGLDFRSVRSDGRVRQGWPYMDASLPCPERSEGTQQLQTDAGSTEGPYWRPRFEATWATSMAPVRDRWRTRASTADLTESQVIYAQKRVQSLSRPYYEREDACGSTGTEVGCGCWVGAVAADPAGVTPDAFKGTRGKRKRGMREEMVRWHECRRHLTCPRCRASRSVKYGAKIRDALQTQMDQRNAHPARRGRRRP